jgi:hypothetical protein
MVVFLGLVEGTVVLLSVVVGGSKRSAVLEEKMLDGRMLVFVQVVDSARCFVFGALCLVTW